MKASWVGMYCLVQRSFVRLLIQRVSQLWSSILTCAKRPSILLKSPSIYELKSDFTKEELSLRLEHVNWELLCIVKYLNGGRCHYKANIYSWFYVLYYDFYLCSANICKEQEALWWFEKWSPKKMALLTGVALLSPVWPCWEKCVAVEVDFEVSYILKLQSSVSAHSLLPAR